MLKIPSRTHATNLTDDELILLDAMFDKRRSMRQLQAENFGEAINFPPEYIHQLDDYELRDALGSLVARGWVDMERADSNRYMLYGLTTAGGDVWELERQPDWDRYVRSSSWCERIAGLDQWLAEVLSPSVEIAAAFYSSDREVKIHKAGLTILDDYDLLYWKTFPTIYQILAPYSPLMDWPSVDWEVYEQNRVWWRDLMELGGLPEK
ncbi:MAG: hypothetical protein HY862_04780 [Chloroflexi bacterium]|nr:hypothetical protein [Chloroflexota bacterium]